MKNEDFKRGFQDGVVSVLRGENIGKEAVIIYMMVGSGISDEDIQKVFGISQKEIGQIYHNAFLYFQKVLYSKEQRALQRLIIEAEAECELIAHQNKK